MNTVSFADLVNQQISFDRETPSGSLVLDLVDTSWMQRLRDINQTGNTRLVYMFSEHSRFGHSLGVAYLAQQLLERLWGQDPDQINEWRVAVSGAALLHDLGHLAPGSHTAFRAWFPEQKDTHEEIAMRISGEDPEVGQILHDHDISGKLTERIKAILREDPTLPPWTWEIISGGGWNVDRGNWCVIDSTLAGVSYGHYNIPALIDSIVLTKDNHLALSENRIDAMMHFAVSRHAMYRQVYQHRTLLSADTLTIAIVQRARDLGGKVPFADEHMKRVLTANSPEELPLQTIFAIRESWWKYHIFQWSQGPDPILKDLCSRLLNRQLLKTIRVLEGEDPVALRSQLEQAAYKAGLDPRYYVQEIQSGGGYVEDSRDSMRVITESGAIKLLSDADGLFGLIGNDGSMSVRRWFCVPKEVKITLGRRR